MYHYDPNAALDELRDDATLPHPVHLRDMILRNKLDPVTCALDLNREFQEYLTRFGELQSIGAKHFGKVVDRDSQGIVVDLPASFCSGIRWKSQCRGTDPHVCSSTPAIRSLKKQIGRRRMAQPDAANRCGRYALGK